MYRDTIKKTNILLIIVLLAAALFAWRFFLSSGTRQDVYGESENAIRKAVEQTALQCYVIEGAYPRDLDYLKENYGLRVNTDDFVIVYRPLGDNRVPDIRVVRREK